MSATDSTETPSQRGAHWSQLVFAAILNIILPNSGGAYLGLPSRVAETFWQRKQSQLFYVGLALFIVIPGIVSMELQTVAFAAFVWLVTGSITAIRDCRAALRNPDAVKVQAIESNTWLAFFYFAFFAFIGLDNSPLQSLTIFRAPAYPPIVTDTETLLGFKYSHDRIHLQRGQLVLASVNHEPKLVRIIAVPGDIFVPGPYAINVNAVSITLGRVLEDIVEALNNPGKNTDIASISDGSVKLSGTGNAEPQIPGRDRYIVAFDQDLADPNDPKQPTLLTFTIGREDIVSIPWGKLWSLGDHPGDGSDLAQPSIVFAD